MSSAEPRFVLDVCGFEHTYMELEGSVFLDVTEKLAVPVTAPAQPSGLDAPTSPPTTPPATDQKTKEPAK